MSASVYRQDLKHVDWVPPYTSILSRPDDPCCVPRGGRLIGLPPRAWTRSFCSLMLFQGVAPHAGLTVPVEGAPPSMYKSHQSRVRTRGAQDQRGRYSAHSSCRRTKARAEIKS